MNTKVMMPRIYLLLAVGTLAFGALSIGCGMAAASEPIDPAHLTFFESKVRPLLAEHCWSCHGKSDQKGGLRLDVRGHLLAGGDSGESVVPGDPDASLLIEAVRYESYEMPPSGKLSDGKIAILEKWVQIGAPWPGSDDATVERDHDSPFSEEDYRW